MEKVNIPVQTNSRRLLKENSLDKGEMKPEDMLLANLGPNIRIGYRLINDKIMLCFEDFYGLIDSQTAKECIERLQKTYSILSQENISEINLLTDKRRKQRRHKQYSQKALKKLNSENY